jgi:hypothetical protein
MLALSQSLARSGGAPYGLEAADKGFEAFLHSLFAREAENRPESDAAVRRYILTGAWPAQSPWAEYITFLRVQCAAEFACQLIVHDGSAFRLLCPCERSDADVLGWLLLDHWERCFDVHLKLVAVSLFFSLPFYGLTPARE